MGKRKTPATIRAYQQSRESEVAFAVASKSRKIESKPDVDLFTLDTEGDGKKKGRVRQSADADGDAVDTVSAGYSRKLSKLAATHTPSTLLKLAVTARSKLPTGFNQALKAKKLRRSKDATPEADLWEEGVPAKTDKKSKFVNRGGTVPGMSPAEVLNPSLTTRTSRDKHLLGTRALRDRSSKVGKNVAVDVAHQGQSYNPDPSAHQEMLGAAVAVEYRRKEKVLYDRTPVENQGMSEGVLKYLNQESDGESSSSDDDDDDDDDESDGPNGGRRISVNPVVRRAKKLTKAERNRQRRTKDLLTKQRLKKEEKRFMATVLDTKKTKKAVAKELRDKEATRVEKKRILTEKSLLPRGVNLEELDATRNVKKALTLAVALTSEVGSLRTVIKKGDLLRDRQLSLGARGAVMMKNERERKRTEGKKRRELMKKQDKFIF